MTPTIMRRSIPAPTDYSDLDCTVETIGVTSDAICSNYCHFLVYIRIDILQKGLRGKAIVWSNHFTKHVKFRGGVLELRKEDSRVFIVDMKG